MGMNGQSARTRYGAGKELELAQRDAKAAELRSQGLTFEQIADQLKLSDRSHAKQCIDRAYKRISMDGAEDLRTQAREQHDQLMSDLRQIIDTTHYAHNNGRLVLGSDGQPLVDDGPKIQAINTMIRLLDRQAKREGLDAPARQTVTVITEDAVDAEIRRLQEQLAELDRPVIAQE